MPPPPPKERNLVALIFMNLLISFGDFPIQYVGKDPFNWCNEFGGSINCIKEK
jgi:hypothetical protein